LIRKQLKIRNRVISNKGCIISIVVICAISQLNNNETSGQNSSEWGGPVSASNQSQIVLSKVATANTIITNKTVFVGGFDTDYSITGTLMNIKYSEDLIISSIVEDFTKSPTVGYVMVSKSMSNSSDMTGITNPFASNEQINQKIQGLLSKSIDESTNSDTDLVEVQCSFGNSLDIFSCSSSPSVR
jgi:hypothetical protein